MSGRRGWGRQRKKMDDRWWVPDRNIGRKEGREGGGGREMKQQRVIKMERGRYKKIEEESKERESLRAIAAHPASLLYLQCS